MIIVAVLGSSMASAAARLPCDSVVSYRALLLYVSEAAKSPKPDIDHLIASVPAKCSFEIGGKHFQPSTSQLHAELQDVKKAEDKDRAETLQLLQKTIQRRLTALDGFARGVDSTVKPKLQLIFQQREFRNVGSQDARALLREKLLQLLIALFSLIAKNPEQAALFAEIFAWSVVVLVALFVLWKLYRWATRPRPLDVSREIMPFAPSAKAWQQWMRDARAALASGDLREAIHSSYWAAISHLEASGAWIPDKARTPREYLRLIGAADPARPLLTEISWVFEVVWYGNRIPAPAECEAFLAKVEQIACH